MGKVVPIGLFAGDDHIVQGTVDAAEDWILVNQHGHALGFGIVPLGLDIERVTAADCQPRALTRGCLHEGAQGLSDGKRQVGNKAGLQVGQEGWIGRSGLSGKKRSGQFPNPLGFGD